MEEEEDDPLAELHAHLQGMTLTSDEATGVVGAIVHRCELATDNGATDDDATDNDATATTIPHQGRRPNRNRCCFHFQRHGTCRFGAHCRFPHPGANNPRAPPCHHFRKFGNCHYGARCRFWHVRTPVRPCFYFRQHGTCRYGVNCRFAHSVAAAPGSSPSGEHQSNRHRQQRQRSWQGRPAGVLLFAPLHVGQQVVQGHQPGLVACQMVWVALDAVLARCPDNHVCLEALVDVVRPQLRHDVVQEAQRRLPDAALRMPLLWEALKCLSWDHLQALAKAGYGVPACVELPIPGSERCNALGVNLTSAGMCEPGERPLDTALREARSQAGLGLDAILSQPRDRRNVRTRIGLAGLPLAFHMRRMYVLVVVVPPGAAMVPDASMPGLRCFHEPGESQVAEDDDTE